jgi:glycosyltransferase involved in cell wall biosynthesis
VDDCSSDDSLEIIREYSKNYQNLIVLNLEKNQGESAARNAGVALAKGEYLAFVDNDDEIDLNFYEKLYEKAAKTNADIIKGQAIEITYNGQEHIAQQLRENDNKLFFAAYWWAAIYKRSLIAQNNISFSVDHCLGGDLLFLNEAVIAAKNLQIVNGVYYSYYRREDSGDSKILSEKKIKSALSIYEMIIDNINAKVLPDDSAYKFIFHHLIMGCFYLALKSDDKKAKQTCAKVAANIFGKCQDQDGLQISFTNTAPHLYALLKHKDTSGVEDVLMKCKSRMELVASGLRARIKNKMN